MEDIINFKNIDVKYDNELVLKDINLDIKQGEHWAILGANGCGKSTLIKLMQSQIHPIFSNKSEKKIFGKSRYSIWELKQHLGIISNDLHNYVYEKVSYLSAYELVLSGYYATFGIFKEEDFTPEQHQKAYETMQSLQIDFLKERKIRQLSTGELRKCIIARALIHEPKALILDEPTVGLDIKSQINFIDMLRKLSFKCSIILVTHHIEEIFSEIGNIALIYDKTIYKKGGKKDILTSENLSYIFDISLDIGLENSRYFIKKV